MCLCYSLTVVCDDFPSTCLVTVDWQQGKCPFRWNWFLSWIVFWTHDDVIKWEHFPCYWPFVRGIHRSRWNPHTKASDVRGALMFSLICAWIDDWVDNREVGDLRRHRGHNDVTVMPSPSFHPQRWPVLNNRPRYPTPATAVSRSEPEGSPQGTYTCYWCIDIILIVEGRKTCRNELVAE